MITVDTPAPPADGPTIGMITVDTPACRDVIMPLVAPRRPSSSRVAPRRPSSPRVAPRRRCRAATAARAGCDRNEAADDPDPAYLTGTAASRRSAVDPLAVRTTAPTADAAPVMTKAMP
jgi:hypothetical protein